MRSLLAFWMGGARSTPPPPIVPALNIFRVDQAGGGGDLFRSSAGGTGDIFRVDQSGAGKIFR
jgi:hypothetical protein